MKQSKKIIFASLFVILLFGIIATASGMDLRFLDWLYLHTKEVDTFISNHPIASTAGMVGFYWLLLSFGLPTASLLNIVSGYFFGMINGSLIAIAGLMGSALFTYWLGRTYVYRWLYKHYKDRLMLIKNEVDQNGPFYVFAVRLSTIFPFFWVNLLFGASGLRWKHYVWPTFFGLIPGSALFLHVGSTLASLDLLSGTFSPKLAGLFVSLGLLALLPIFFRRFFN
jgi:uncharacterized membrane protein YdjX (TVP38/TMEM64 family)